MSSPSDTGNALQSKTINLYCRKCDSQIGICQNDWLQLPSAYAVPKDKGTDFGSIVANRKQPVLTKNDVRGCVLSEINCASCSEAVGQYCVEAPHEKKHLLNRHWYRLPKIFLKDSRSFLRTDPIFAKGYDSSRARRSHSTTTALPRSALSPSPYSHSVDGRSRALHSPALFPQMASDGQGALAASSPFAQPFGHEQGPYSYPPQYIHPSGYQDPAFQMTSMFNSSIDSPFPRHSMPPPDVRRASSVAPEAPVPPVFNPDISFDDLNIPPLEIDSMTSQLSQQPMATLLRKFDEQDAKLTKMTQSVHELKLQIGRLITSFRYSSLHNLAQDATIEALEDFMDGFKSTVHASDDAEMEKLRAENESMKAKLQSIASAMGTVAMELMPASTPSSTPSILSSSVSSLGKRKRANETKRPSLLQNEVSITDLEDDEASNEVPSESSARTKDVPNAEKDFEAAPTGLAWVENTETETRHAATPRPEPLTLSLNCNSFVQDQVEQVLTPPGSNVPDDGQVSESQESSKKKKSSNRPDESAVATSFDTSQERALVPKLRSSTQPQMKEADSLAAHDHATNGTTPSLEAGDQSSLEGRSDAAFMASSATANGVGDTDNDVEAPPQPEPSRRTRQQTRRVTEGVPPTKPAVSSPVATRKGERRKTTDTVLQSNDADKENHDPEEPKRKRKKTARAALEDEQISPETASPDGARRPLSSRKDNNVSVLGSQEEKTISGDKKTTSTNPRTKPKHDSGEKDGHGTVQPEPKEAGGLAPVPAQVPAFTATTPSDTPAHQSETATSISDPHVNTANIQPPPPTNMTTTTTPTTIKRPRRAPHQIERNFRCSFLGCDRAYGTLPHLNTHIVQLKHGEKWTLKGYKERFEGDGGEIGEGSSQLSVNGEGRSRGRRENDSSVSIEGEMEASGPIQAQIGTATEVEKTAIKKQREEERLARIRHRDQLAKEVMDMEELLEIETIA